MYEDHWYASAQETPAAQQQQQQQQSRRARRASIKQAKALEKIAAAKQKNTVVEPTPKKTVGPPKADVLPRASSFESLRDLVRSADGPEEEVLPSNLKLSDERDVLAWYEEFEDDLQDANELEYIVFQEILNSHIFSCDKLLSDSVKTLSLLDDLSQGFDAVRQQTSTFQASCEGLITEQRRLSTMADDLAFNLDPFSSLESITRRLNSPGSDLVLKSDFKEMLNRLDSSLSYVATHPTFKDAEFYRSRYRQCLTRALTLVKVYFNNQLREISNDVTKRVAAKGLNETTQSALLYAKFRVGAPQLRDLIYEIERRCDHEEYLSLMTESYNAYSAIRQRLLLPIITRKMNDMAANKDVLSFAGASLTYIKSICLDEYDLFYSFFSSGEHELYDFLEGLCEPLYDHLRPRIIHETELIRLCELCSLLQSRYMKDPDEVEYESYDRSQLDFSQLIKPPLQDTQTRVVFRAQAVIKDEIENFVPKADDLDYPNRNRSEPEKSTLSVSSPQQENENKPFFDTESVFIGWYPTLRKSIWLLSKIYRLVNSIVFDDIAHEVVHVCITSLLRASDLIKSQKTNGDAQLFLLKHLLLLKEQIVAFDIEYVRPDVDIDFSSVTGTFWELREKGNLFNPNNLFKIMQKGLPKVVANMLDAKEELDGRLRSIINEFTASWASKITTAIRESSGKGSQVLEDIGQMQKTAETEVPQLRQKLLEYISDSRTRETLVGAVQELVIESYETFYDRVDKVLVSRTEILDVDSFIEWSNETFGGLVNDDDVSVSSGRQSPLGSTGSNEL